MLGNEILICISGAIDAEGTRAIPLQQQKAARTIAQYTIALVSSP